MTSEASAAPRWTWGRRLRIAAIVAASLLLLSFAGSLLLPDQDPMPDVVWVSGFTSDPDHAKLQFRADAADGEHIQGTRVASSWSGSGAGPAGLSVRRPLRDLAKAKVSLAKLGVLPFARIDYAGFESTGRAEVRDGVEWKEFRKFGDAFGQTGIGWGVKFW